MPGTVPCWQRLWLTSLSPHCKSMNHHHRHPAAIFHCCICRFWRTFYNSDASEGFNFPFLLLKKKYMRSTDLLWGYDSDFFDILHTQPHDVGIKRKWAPRLGFSPSFFRLASVLPPSFLSKFFKGPSDRLIPALCTYTFPPKPSKASTSFTYLPQFKHLRCSEPQSAAFYLCHHVERLTSKEEEKKGGVGGSGSDGELKEFHLARDETHRLEKNLQRMRELLPQLPFFC